MKKEALRLTTTIPAAPTTLYLAWLNTEQHSAMTGGAAKIDSQVGGKYTAWNGIISGKLVTLDLGRRIIMSCRTSDCPREEPDSRVEIQLDAMGGSTRLTILQTEIPEGQSDKYREIWNEKYFAPMRSFFSKYLPDPRLPPPPRRPIPPEDDEEEEEEETRASDKKAIKAASKLAPKTAAKAAAPPSKAKVAPKAPEKPAKAAPPAKPAAKAAKPAAKAAKPAAKAAKPAAKAAKAAKPAPKKAPPKKPAKPVKGKKK